MLNIFYQKIDNIPTLMINLSLLKHNFIKTIGDITYGYFGDKVVFINILNFISNSLGKKFGLVFPTDEIINEIKAITNLDLSKYFDNGFKVGKILNCQKINNTHLNLCDVTIDNKTTINIVCGAKNVKKNLKVVVATKGTMLPSGKLIVKTNLLNFESNGMLCSYQELNLIGKTSGIIELDEEYCVGNYYFACYTNK